MKTLRRQYPRGEIQRQPFQLSFNASLAVLANSPTVASAQVQVGCGTNPFQDWFLVDPQNWFMTIQGTITNTPVRNSGRIFDDGDWNIHVRPSTNVRVLTNSHGNANTDGRIEFEINSSGPNLSTIFKKDARIEARGMRFQDSGHDDKTELHPLDYIRTLVQNPMHIFMGQDQTGRFLQTTVRNTQIFGLDTATTPRLVTRISFPPSDTLILYEHAQLSKGETDFLLYPNYIELDSSLGGWWFSDCENVQSVSYGDGPFYCGVIDRKNAALLTEAVRYSVSTIVGTTQKEANLTVTIDLADPPTGQIKQSIWEYESSAGTVIGVARETRNTRPHRFTFSMPYAPATGYTQHRWTMNVFGTTIPEPNFRQNAADFATSYDRTWVMERRVYELDPSQIGLNVTSKKTTQGCTQSSDFRLDTTRLLP